MHIGTPRHVYSMGINKIIGMCKDLCLGMYIHMYIPAVIERNRSSSENARCRSCTGPMTTSTSSRAGGDLCTCPHACLYACLHASLYDVCMHIYAHDTMHIYLSQAMPSNTVASSQKPVT